MALPTAAVRAVQAADANRRPWKDQIGELAASGARRRSLLGILAFRPQRGRAARWALVLAAGACFVQAYFIARFHHPLGVLQLLLG